jgi:hypothetical protein
MASLGSSRPEPDVKAQWRATTSPSVAKRALTTDNISCRNFGLAAAFKRAESKYFRARAPNPGRGRDQLEGVSGEGPEMDPLLEERFMRAGTKANTSKSQPAVCSGRVALHPEPVMGGT